MKKLLFSLDILLVYFISLMSYSNFKIELQKLNYNAIVF